MVTVCPDEGTELWKITVSCANGKAFTLPVPPVDVSHGFNPEFQFSPLPITQYLFTPAENVIPLLPLQSPKRVPLTGAAAPAMVMSRKSASVPEKAAQVSVRVVPMVSDCKNVLIVALVPAESVSVPVMVWLAVMLTVFTPAEVWPAKVKLLYVFAPFKVTVPVPVTPVNDTL